MTTFLIAIPLVAVAMLGLGLGLVMRGRPMKRSGCGAHASGRNAMLGERCERPTCACDGADEESAAGQ